MDLLVRFGMLVLYFVFGSLVLFCMFGRKNPCVKTLYDKCCLDVYHVIVTVS